FSSRRRHTRSKRDWSSDVCSSSIRLRCRSGGSRLSGPSGVSDDEVDAHEMTWRVLVMAIPFGSGKFVECPSGHLFAGSGDAGQVGRDGPGEGDVIEGDNAELLGNEDPAALATVENPERHHVVIHNDCAHIRGEYEICSCYSAGEVGLK